MSHGTLHGPGDLLDTDLAAQAARVMHALAAPSRLRLLACLHEGPACVGELSARAGAEQSAVSHQLRVLREQELVVGERVGRQVIYRLHDEHVAELLTQALSHVEHLRLGLADAVETESMAS